MVPQIMNYHHTPYWITMQHLQNQQAICLVWKSTASGGCGCKWCSKSKKHLRKIKKAGIKIKSRYPTSCLPKSGWQWPKIKSRLPLCCPSWCQANKIKHGKLNDWSQAFKDFTDWFYFQMKIKINVRQGLEILDLICSHRRGILIIISSCLCQRTGNRTCKMALFKCPNLWCNSCSQCYGMDCFGTYLNTCPNLWCN